MDVGQTIDMEWTPTAPGIYVLEVSTAYLTFAGPPMQRIAFGVGAVTDTDLGIAATGTSLLLADPSSESLAHLAGAYGDPSSDLVSVWNGPSGLKMSRTVAQVESPAVALVALANGTFVPATIESGVPKEVLPLVPHRFAETTLTAGTAGSARHWTRVTNFALDAATLLRYAGPCAKGATVTLKDGTLVMAFASGASSRLVPDSPSRFVGNFGGPVVFEFVSQEGKVVSLGAPEVGYTAARLPDK